jgi:hypothetical protein
MRIQGYDEGVVARQGEDGGDDIGTWGKDAGVAEAAGGGQDCADGLADGMWYEARGGGVLGTYRTLFEEALSAPAPVESIGYVPAFVEMVSSSK